MDLEGSLASNRSFDRTNGGVKTDLDKNENYILRSKTATNLILRIQTMIHLPDYECVVENRSQEWFHIQKSAGLCSVRDRCSMFERKMK